MHSSKHADVLLRFAVVHLAHYSDPIPSLQAKLVLVIIGPRDVRNAFILILWRPD